MATEFAAAIDALKPRRDEDSWAPLVIDASSEDAAERIRDLIQSGRVHYRCDEVNVQLAELVESREPSTRFTDELRRQRMAGVLGTSPIHAYGVWVFYPWLQSLVHLLPEEAFVELRTNRNRYKISPDEQRRLRAKTVGIVGLSVGMSSAVTMALEGVGGCFRLADHDHLSLSNMNRIAASCAELGTNKAVIAARRMLEIDPFLRIEVVPAGLSAADVSDFLAGLDLVVEECDDLDLKFAIRAEARRRRIPVIMETSDRGTLDVERFDLVPARPLFHGLAPEPTTGRRLTTKEKVPLVLRILETSQMSAELAASMVEIEQSVSTWPQLGSAVALGGGLLTDAARRVLLGSLSASGRIRVDFGELVSDERFLFQNAQLGDEEISVADEARHAPRLPALERGATLERDVETMIAYAVRAPSGGNAQPWSFELGADGLVCRVDASRGSYLDYDGRASLLALGAAVLNLELAAQAIGYEIDARFEHDECRVRFRASEPARDPLVVAIERRCTNRRVGRGESLAVEHRARLDRAAQKEGGTLRILTEPEALAKLGEIVGATDRLLYLNPTLHQSLMKELRWTAAEAASTRDGVDLATLEISATDRAALEVVRRAEAMTILRSMKLGHALATPSRRALRAAGAACLVVAPRSDRPGYFEGGRVLERVWLEATLCDLGVHPMGALLYLHARVSEGAAPELAPDEAAQVRELAERLLSLFEVGKGELPVLLLRLAYADPPPAFSLRRPASWVSRPGGVGSP